MVITWQVTNRAKVAIFLRRPCPVTNLWPPCITATRTGCPVGISLQRKQGNKSSLQRNLLCTLTIRRQRKPAWGENISGPRNSLCRKAEDPQTWHTWPVATEAFEWSRLNVGFTLCLHGSTGGRITDGAEPGEGRSWKSLQIFPATWLQAAESRHKVLHKRKLRYDTQFQTDPSGLLY